MFGGYSGGAVLFLLPVVCRQGNFSARTGNKCFFLSSDEPSCHLPSAESEFRHFPSLQTTATAVCRKIEPETMLQQEGRKPLLKARRQGFRRRLSTFPMLGARATTLAQVSLNTPPGEEPGPGNFPKADISHWETRPAW